MARKKATAAPGRSSSRQSHQRKHNHWKRSAANQQSSQCRFEAGGQQPRNESELSRSAVPSIPSQAGHPIAIKAMAAKRACPVYRMLRYGTYKQDIDRTQREACRPPTLQLVNFRSVLWQALAFHSCDAPLKVIYWVMPIRTKRCDR